MEEQIEIPVPDGYMKDGQGRLVPESMVKAIDRGRDDLAKEIVTKAKALAEKIAVFKNGAMEDIQAFIDLSSEKYGVKAGGAKGNVTLLSFDGRYKIQRAMDEKVTFDERLQIAKKLIDECIHEWAEGSRAEIRTLINDAFNVDKKGKLNVNRILGLRRLDIQDGKWQRAMTAIGESLQVTGSKAYIRIYERQPDGSYKQISLDVAA